MFEGFNRCKAEVYFDRLDQLIITVRTALYQVDLSNYPNFSEFLLGLIKYTETYYPKNGNLRELNLCDILITTTFRLRKEINTTFILSFYASIDNNTNERINVWGIMEVNRDRKEKKTN